MALQTFPGAPYKVGPPIGLFSPSGGNSSITSDAVNEAAIFIGRWRTSDGASHVLDTTGSSNMGWRTGGNTLTSASTTVKVGLAAVDTSSGPTARPVNSSNVITFDVSASFLGNSGSITSGAWQSHVPDTGSKTIANGDLAAFAVQMTARGSSDAVFTAYMPSNNNLLRPTVSEFNGGSFGNIVGLPNVFITFADGAFGWIEGCEIFSALSTRTWNSGSATKEYGQLYQFPYPVKICGIYGTIQLSSADCDVVLYSDPLGTPAAAVPALTMDQNTISSGFAGRWFEETFASPYSLPANTPIVAAYKPAGSNVVAPYKTLAAASHRIADGWGTSGYGVSRASGAFANVNSSLEHYYIGLKVEAGDDGATVGGGGAHFAATIF